MQELEREIVIQNKLGLHARPASQFVQLTSRFSSDIVLRKQDTEVNGKSIMGVLMLAAPRGTTLKVVARGEDAREALDKIEELVSGKFGEE